MKADAIIGQKSCHQRPNDLRFQPISNRTLSFEGENKQRRSRQKSAGTAIVHVC